VTDPLLPEPAPPRRRVLRELAGLFCVLFGLAGVLLAAGAVDWRLLLAISSMIVAAGGLWLGADRDGEG
jgi:hypothetical protein